MSADFTSRWLQWPDHVSLTEGGFPAGFSGGTAAAGLKASGKEDLALILCDSPDCTSAIRQTRSSAAAAPVLVNRTLVETESIRAIVANSGNANAGTGQDGLTDAIQVRYSAASALGVEPEYVAVCSTGVIGQRLDAVALCAAMPAAVGNLSSDSDHSVAGAIMTTDKAEKRFALDVDLPEGTVRLTAQAKGAGMIQPSFATMFCFLQTDAKLSSETCDLLLGTVVKRSFERISVDGQLSTNDVVILMASGASGITVAPQSESEALFGQALDALVRALALEIVADGEGAVRVARVLVEGGDDDTVEHVARTVAGSPLVKAALHGGDPNWGRILGAVGMALPDSPGMPVDIEIEGIEVCSAGAMVPFDEEALNKAVSGSEVEYTVRVPGSGSLTEVFFSDLSHEYVTINSEYTT
ncbi:MAG: bifunctional glutamate N-acetyltransferase/amino-acid acetyltransferase ArgJ [Actinobacteria bacterium]|uniref:Unannotated protein n=1 Tax=freshwater metagenome TaxID=449393 RepID=A0A6J7EDW8_9ZZZZ|nr:bifunctional glutamate N-acetyltransferase/amino-acid acetyltransferase ArgJ [Actinomycetota bacterium]